MPSSDVMNGLPIGVIGAGASGLAMAMQLRKYGVTDFVVLEERHTVGGVWSSSSMSTKTCDNVVDEQRRRRAENNDNNRHEHHCQPPMYEGLRTNLPLGLMAYRGIPFAHHLSMKGSPTDVQEYLNNVYHTQLLSNNQKDSKVKEQFHFSRRVHSTEFRINDNGEFYWIVKTSVLNVKQECIDEEIYKFRALIVCNGHYTVPNIPNTYKNNKNFNGRVVHSSQFHSPTLYDDKTVLIVGGMSSSVDIATLLLNRNRCKGVHISIRTSCGSKDNFSSTNTCSEVPNVVLQVLRGKPRRLGAMYHAGIREFVDGNTILFNEDTVARDVDVIILATGYLYSFPFLPEDIENQLLISHFENGRDPIRGWRVRNLYKRVWYPNLMSSNTPTRNFKASKSQIDVDSDDTSTSDIASALSFVGLPNGLLSPWILFEFQARWIARVHAGLATLPSMDVMQEESKIFDSKSAATGRDSLWFATGRYCNEVSALAFRENFLVSLREGYWFGIWTYHAWQILKMTTLFKRNNNNNFENYCIRGVVAGMAVLSVAVSLSWRMN